MDTGGSEDIDGALVIRSAVIAPVKIPVDTPVVDPVREPLNKNVPRLSRPWKVIVWDDPVNLMSYVTFVFCKVFGYSQAKARKLMMQVHTEGKAVVSSGAKEKAEHYVFHLHAHGLWATMEQDR